MEYIEINVYVFHRAEFLQLGSRSRLKKTLEPEPKKKLAGSPALEKGVQRDLCKRHLGGTEPKRPNILNRKFYMQQDRWVDIYTDI